MILYIYDYLDYKEVPQRSGKGWWWLMSDVTQRRAKGGPWISRWFRDFEVFVSPLLQY